MLQSYPPLLGKLSAAANRVKFTHSKTGKATTALVEEIKKQRMN